MQCRFATALIVLALASPAAAQTAAAARRDGYAWPTDRSPAAEALPRANPPEGPGWGHDLDLPAVDAYQAEVLRYVRSGLGPTFVAQFAVVATGEPAQAMIERTADREHPGDVTRAFGQIPWRRFLQLKATALAPMTEPPAEPSAASTGQVVVGAVDELCTLEYSGLGLTVRRRVDCGGVGPLEDASQALVDAARRAAAPAPATSGRRPAAAGR